MAENYEELRAQLHYQAKRALDIHEDVTPGHAPFTDDELEQLGETEEWQAINAIAALITERDALSAQLSAEKSLVHYWRTLAQLYAAPPHDVAAQLKIITDGP